jgi:hypothetical protein
MRRARVQERVGSKKKTPGQQRQHSKVRPKVTRPIASDVVERFETDVPRI